MFGNFELVKLKYITLKIGSGSTPLGAEKAYTDSGGILTDNLVYISDEIDSQMSNS